MIGLAAALVVIGIVLLFIVPWVGIPLAVVGALIAIVYLVSFGRRAMTANRP
jgi:hypothetical protein